MHFASSSLTAVISKSNTHHGAPPFYTHNHYWFAYSLMNMDKSALRLRQDVSFVKQFRVFYCAKLNMLKLMMRSIGFDSFAAQKNSFFRHVFR